MESSKNFIGEALDSTTLSSKRNGLLVALQLDEAAAKEKVKGGHICGDKLRYNELKACVRFCFAAVV